MDADVEQVLVVAQLTTEILGQAQTATISRNMANTIGKQNWPAVVLEVVVVGILVGLQVVSWNGARKLQSLQREYLERLHQDISRSTNFRGFPLLLPTGVILNLNRSLKGQ